MTRYMVLIPNSPPEYVEADDFKISEQHVLELYVKLKRTAAFVNWIGVKEAYSPASATITSTTTSNPARAKIKAHFSGSSSREPLVIS